jgi:NhaA family Na+:H+ antiporter
MSLFVTNLAFPGHEELVNSAKLGIFTASILAALIGWQLIRRLAPAAGAAP